MIDQIPVWFWWLAAVCLIAFIGFLMGIISWFLSKFVSDNKESWTEVKDNINEMTDGINKLVTVTTVQEHRITQLEKQR